MKQSVSCTIHNWINNLPPGTCQYRHDREKTATGQVKRQGDAGTVCSDSNGTFHRRCNCKQNPLPRRSLVVYVSVLTLVSEELAVATWQCSCTLLCSCQRGTCMATGHHFATPSVLTWSHTIPANMFQQLYLRWQKCIVANSVTILRKDVDLFKCMLCYVASRFLWVLTFQASVSKLNGCSSTCPETNIEKCWMFYSTSKPNAHGEFWNLHKHSQLMSDTGLGCHEDPMLRLVNNDAG